MDQYRRIYHLLCEGVFVLKPYWLLHVLIIVATVAIVAIETSLPLAIRYLIDQALIPHDATKLFSVLIVLVLLFVFASASRLANAIVRAHVHKELYWDLSILLFSYLKRLPLSYFDHLQPGHFAPIFDYDLLTFTQMVRDAFVRGFQAALQFAVVAGTMVLLNWKLGLFVLVLLPLATLRPQKLLKPSLDAFDVIRMVVVKVNGHVQDYVATQMLTRVFGRGEEESKRFNEDIAGRKGARNRLCNVADFNRTRRLPHFTMQAFKLSMDTNHAALTLLVIGGGAWLTFTGGLSLGSFSAFVLLLPIVLRAVGTLAEYVHDLGRATQSLERLEGVRKNIVPETDASSGLELGQMKGEIEFRHINFGYAPDRPNIRDVNLSLPLRRSVAFVGRSGAGKSTLFKLLLGLYKPTAGQIRIDGHDLGSISPSSIGSRIGTVLQTSLMVNASIGRNISFAKPDATKDEIICSARAAGIHDFVSSLPDAYDSPVGENGKWLSEGQKQRIALARALLPSPDVLLLDEVTSSLDPESERSINTLIQTLANDRTVMVVTHRLASVTFADLIVVMDQGRVKEQGSHDELLRLGGLYHHLWQMQTGFLISGDGNYAEVSGERLGAIPLFRSVDIEALDQLAGRFVSQRFQAGEKIYDEGDTADRFYILVRGSVSITSRDAAQRLIHLAELQDGDYFGEVEMINKGRRTTSVTARMPSLLLTLYADQFDTMADNLGSLSKIVTQMALGRSLSTISSIGRRRRSHAVWKKLREIA